MTTKDALHRLVEQLPETDWPTAEAFLEFLRLRRDPLLQLLRTAPEDDEPTTAEDIADAEAAWQEYREGKTIAADVARHRFGPDARRRIFSALDRLTEDPPRGDVRKLTGGMDEWRLRVGSWRVLFRYDREANVIVVGRVRDRKEAYRD